VLTIEVADARILGHTETIVPPVLEVVAAFIVGLLTRQEPALENLAALEYAVACLGILVAFLQSEVAAASFAGKSSPTIVRVAYGPCKVIASL
jgi:hypothetical protein